MSRRRRAARRSRAVEAPQPPVTPANPLDAVEPPAEWFPAPDLRAEVLAGMTVVGLRQLAVQSGVSLKGAKTKAAIIAALTA